MPLRVATYTDLAQIATVLAAAFYDEELNDYFFPYRSQYPDDYLRAWRHVVVEKWWNYNNIWIVSYGNRRAEKVLATGPAVTDKVMTGAALWSRVGPEVQGFWSFLGWWDPRRFISTLIRRLHSFHRSIFLNRAVRDSSPADPKPIRKWDFELSIWPFISRHFIGVPHRQNHWELCLLGVLPNHHGCGVGHDLVAWGLSRAKDENLPVAVITAAGTEQFYQRQGFKHYVGSASQEDMVVVREDVQGQVTERKVVVNPLKLRGIGGGSIFWTGDSMDVVSSSMMLVD